MKRSSTLFLQVLIVLIGLAALTFLLWMPQVEGRNVNATWFEIYFQDPFLAFAYVGSISFFVALYQAFKVLGSVAKNNVFSKEAVKAMRTIKYCAFMIIGFVIAGEAWIMTMTGEDRAGGIAMGIFIAFGSIVVVTAATVFERVLQNAVDLKSENDLTV